MNKLIGKRILFFAPAFFGYEIKILEKMKQLGAEVDFFDERSINKSYEKALLKINADIFRKKTINYYENILNKVSNVNYDIVLVIKCEMMPSEILIKMKSLFTNATFCLYLYDSLRNVKNIEKKIPYFDRVLSFDMDDANKNERLIFRPLFFADEYNNQKLKTQSLKYDICFIGTIHSDRYKVIKKIKTIAASREYNVFLYCFLQSKIVYYLYKMTKREFCGVKKSDFEFNKIDSKRISKIISESNVIIDVQHPNQTGLTMRTIEMLGMEKKIITTNEHIKNYDFYDPRNISIIDRNNVEIPSEFIDCSYHKVSDSIFKKYSLEYWIYDVIGGYEYE